MHRGISFLAVDIIHSTEVSWGDFFPFVPFPFFLFVNILGALLGYWIGTKYRIQFFNSKWWKVLWGLIGIISVGLGFVFGVLPFYGEDFGVALFGFGVSLLETTILSYLMNNWSSNITTKD